MKIFDIDIVYNKVQRNILRTFFFLVFFYTFTRLKREHNNIILYGKSKFSNDCRAF